MKNNEKVRLTESELKTMIKEAVSKIITESPLYQKPPVQEDIIEVDLMYLEFSNPQLDEFFEDAECPETVWCKWRLYPYGEEWQKLCQYPRDSYSVPVG